MPVPARPVPEHEELYAGRIRRHPELGAQLVAVVRRELALAEPPHRALAAETELLARDQRLAPELAGVARAQQQPRGKTVVGERARADEIPVLARPEPRRGVGVVVVVAPGLEIAEVADVEA